MAAPLQPVQQGEAREWTNKGSDCCSPASTCLLAWCLPCVLYGRVHHRIHKDPQLKDWSFCNGDCIGYYALACCGCQWILQMMQRGDIRKKHQLKGDGCQDCLCACCCVPCDLMQQDKEVELREGERAGLVVAQPTSEKQQMQYPPAVHSPPAQQVLHDPMASPPAQQGYAQPQPMQYQQHPQPHQQAPPQY